MNSQSNLFHPVHNAHFMPPKQQNRPPTMTDVAKLAGVSQTTVSFVVNNIPDKGIPEDTRQRILDAVKELGYRPNAFAKNLRSQHSHIIGLLTDEILISPHAGKIIQGAQNAAKAAGKIILLSNTEGDPELENAELETMLEHQVDGLIYATMFHRVLNPPEALSEIPAVLLDCYDAGRTLPSVVPDEVHGGLTATAHLLEKGHRRIGFINNVTDVPSVRGRLDGYRQALQTHDIPFRETLVRSGNSTAENGYHSTKQLMQSEFRPTALFCYNDQIAMGAYDALRELGLSIPDDVAVMGFDNQELIAPYLRPPLSTMQLPHYEMGQWAIEHLLQLIGPKGNNEPVQHTLKCRYIERLST